MCARGFKLAGRDVEPPSARAAFPPGRHLPLSRLSPRRAGWSSTDLGLAARGPPTRHRHPDEGLNRSPRSHEQGVAEALSDADTLVGTLERLIEKKRAIKQGAMQELLSGKRRLPGFSKPWEDRHFGGLARIRNSKIHTLGRAEAEHCIELDQIERDTGKLNHWVDASRRSSIKYSFETGDVLFGRIRPYLRKFHWVGRPGICSTEIWPLMPTAVSAGFLYQLIQSDGFIAAACEAYGTHMPRADWGKLSTFEVRLPVDPDEQAAIATLLYNMEEELWAIETHLVKVRAIRQGMMQSLLTGRVRLPGFAPTEKVIEAAE